MSIKAAKSAIRNKIKNTIDQISLEERRRQSLAIHQRLFELKEYQASERISLYLSTPDEIDTVPILKHIFESKKSAFVPRYQGKTMEMVKLSSMEDYETLPSTKWNIKQPDSVVDRENAIEKGLDFIILPGVAFTFTGKRLGHGMGYYDKYLTSMIATSPKKPFLVGVAFNEQIMEDIPTTETDVILDVIVTERNK